MKKNNNNEKDVKNMPSSSKPTRVGGAGASGRAAVSTAPMSERQQMQILLQMTSNAHEAELSPGGSTPKSRERTNERGETSLHIAAKKGDHEAVKKLIDQGNNPNVTDFAGWTPLHEACNHGHYNIALALIKAGANINATGLDDDTALHDAAVFGQMKLVKMLVERGADPLFRNQKGKMPCDVAASAVYNYLIQARDAALGRSSLQQSKKPNDSKQKTGSSDNDDNTGSNIVTISNKEEDDIYEFKSTPKDSCSSSDEKSDAGSCKNEKNDDKISQEVDPLSTPDNTDNIAKASDNIVKVKRPYSDVGETGDESITATAEEDNKRKKRKDSDPVLGKEGGKASNGSSRGAPRQEKGSKVGGAKNLNLANKTILERKSPCASPKPTTNAPSNKTDSDDAEVEDKNTDNTNVNPGPKVPPLKIVIPQQSSSADTEASGSSRNGKNASARSHAALPYVVASNNSNDSNVDKESTSSRSTSPMENTKTTEEKGGKTGDERSQPRVLRSSHRGGSAVDRSNNSSPQLQNSASPSPASKKNANDDEENTPNSGKKSPVNSGTAASPNTTNQGGSNEAEATGANPKSPPNAPGPSNASTSSSSSSSNTQNQQSAGGSNTSEAPVHPRKRKIKTSKDQSASQSSSGSQASSSDDKKDIKEENSESEIHPHDQPITNCYQMFLNIRKQIEKRRRGLYPVQPKPPQGFKDYLLNRCTYALHGKAPSEPGIQFPTSLPNQIKDLFTTQEKERHKLKMQHIVEKEKLVLAVEQEILRVHGRAARALANQSLPFSVCTILKDEEVYNIITPEQEEKDRNARFRYNGRLFLSWLQDVDDKWEKIKEAMLLRHHNEAESLHAVQKMDWEWKLKELSLCELKAKPVIEDNHVPIVAVGDDFDLLPA